MVVSPEMLAALLLAAAAADGASAQTAAIQDVADSAALCMLASGKNGVDRSRFANANWKATSTGLTVFEHVVHPIKIEFPSDKDGIARICTVHATLRSQIEQKGLAANLAKLLRAKPYDQGTSLVWLVPTKVGTRGIQFFLDKASEQPKVRLIGAAF